MNSSALDAHVSPKSYATVVQSWPSQAHRANAHWVGFPGMGGHSVPGAGVDWLLFFYYKLLRINTMQPAVFQRLRRTP